jgi:hypothetical protein
LVFRLLAVLHDLDRLKPELQPKHRLKPELQPSSLMPIDLTRRTRARHSAGLLLGVGLAVVLVAGMGLIVFLGDRAIASKSAPVPVVQAPWNVTVDPGPEWAERHDFALPANASIRTSSSHLVFPTTPVPFVAVEPALDPKAWLVYDLRNWKRVGSPQRLDLPPFTLPVLSPDGRLLAFKGSSKGSPIEVCSVEDVRLRVKIGPAPGMTDPVVDFAGTDRILIGTARASVYEDIPGDWDVRALTTLVSTTTYQVWECSGVQFRTPLLRLVSEFSAPAFHPTRAGFTPGRNYLVMHEFDDKEGHRLVFRDLRTGKQAGSLQIQEPDNPHGAPAGLAFSRDGKQFALLWRLNERPDRWGVLMCWDVATGKKLLEHDLGYLVSSMDLLWPHGGARSIQWLPDGSGWLLFGHLILRREDGTVIRKIGPEPRNASEVAERIFLTPDRYTHFDGKTKTLSLRTLR